MLYLRSYYQAEYTKMPRPADSLLSSRLSFADISAIIFVRRENDEKLQKGT